MISQHNSVELPNKINYFFDSEKLLQLVYSFNAAFDINILFGQFCQILTEELQCDSLQYSYKPINILIRIGKENRYSFTSNELGEIILWRKSEFKPQEIEKIKALLILLRNPLNNLIRYLHAVQSSLHDPLTGVANRGALMLELQHEIELAKRYLTPFSLLAYDLDNFKSINDTYGHLQGDTLLKNIAHHLQHSIRLSDRVFRFGGDEFIIILSETPYEGAIELAKRIHQSTSQINFKINDKNIPITVSIGITSFVVGDTETHLLEKVDTALYRAKRHGRDRVSF